MAKLPPATQATFKSVEEKINKAASRQVKAKAKQIADTVVRLIYLLFTLVHT